MQIIVLSKLLVIIWYCKTCFCFVYLTTIFQHEAIVKIDHQKVFFLTQNVVQKSLEIRKDFLNVVILSYLGPSTYTSS